MLWVTPENIHAHSKEGYLKFQTGIWVLKTKGKHEQKLDEVGGGAVQGKTKPSTEGWIYIFWNNMMIYRLCTYCMPMLLANG